MRQAATSLLSMEGGPGWVTNCHVVNVRRTRPFVEAYLL